MASGKTTPMMRQYHHLKEQYKDKILLFRMGDFYETFGEDAKTISRVLNIALTTRDKKDDPTPLAGFPHHAIGQYLPKLVKAGLNVAVADQMEDPKQAKGIVRREVTRVVTPGTLTDDKSLGEKQNNYLAAVSLSDNWYGIAICDLSTGEFSITQTKSKNRMKEEIGRINPSEILIPIKSDFTVLSNYSIQPLEDYDFDLTTAKELLTNQFNVKSLSSFGITPYKAAIVSAGAIVYYLQSTQKTDLSHIHSIKYFDPSGNMILDESTIRNLDLISSEGEFGKKATLFSVLDKTKTSMGSRNLRRWLLHPLITKKEIDIRHNCVEEFFHKPDILEATQEELKNISDIERVCGKLGLNRANPRDLVSLSRSLEVSLEILETVKPLKSVFSALKPIKTNEPIIKDIIKLIDKSIKDDTPTSLTEGGIIKDGYSKKIDEIRDETSGSKNWIAGLEEKERKRTGIPSLKVRFNKVFGYYIEVTHTHKEKIPEDYIRKQTLVNSERYVTPELKKKEEIVLNAQEILANLEYECFQEIREKLLKYVEVIQSTAESLAQADTYASLAEAARLNDYCRPKIFDMGKKNGILAIQNARHPVIERTSDEQFISNNIEIDTDKNRLLILTGPNMAGKSTYIRQAAIILLMAQIGSFVPASSAEISITDRIFTRVGASDDLSAGRSTFLVEMDEAANIINNATRHSFIVLDEIGRGTSTYDGVAIAWSIAEYIHNNIGARCVFATHYHELLKLEDKLDGVKNYNISVLEEEDKIVFLRKIEKGGTDKSYGIFVAQMAGLPTQVVERATEILEGFEQENMFGVRSGPKSKKAAEDKKTESVESPRSADQLSFMDNNLAQEMPNLFKQLENIDINRTTPIEALKLIETWKKRLSR